MKSPLMTIFRIIVFVRLLPFSLLLVPIHKGFASTRSRRSILNHQIVTHDRLLVFAEPVILPIHRLAKPFYISDNTEEVIALSTKNRLLGFKADLPAIVTLSI